MDEGSAGAVDDPVKHDIRAPSASYSRATKQVNTKIRAPHFIQPKRVDDLTANCDSNSAGVPVGRSYRRIRAPSAASPLLQRSRCLPEAQ